MQIHSKLGSFEIYRAAETDRPGPGIAWSKGRHTCAGPRYMVRSATSDDLWRLIEAAGLKGDNATVFHYHTENHKQNWLTRARIDVEFAPGKQPNIHSWTNDNRKYMPITRARIYVDANSLLLVIGALTQAIGFRNRHRTKEDITIDQGRQKDCCKKSLAR